jgi:hypothetical protein
MTMLFGCNQNHYADVAPHIARMSFLRSFSPLAATWPVMPDGLPSLWSPRPDPADLLTGKLDHEIIQALHSAPAGSMFTTWHEANQSGQSAGTMQKVHAYMHKLVHEHTDAIRYGVVLTQGAPAEWAIAGLDFYGIDLYDLRGGVTNPWLTLNRFNARMPKGPRLVAETNSSVVEHRPAWFRGIFDWLYTHNGLAMLTFWNPTGPLSGPWVDDPATVYALNRIIADANRP